MLKFRHLNIFMLPDSRRGKHLTVGPHTQHNDRGDDHYQICDWDIKTGLWLLAFQLNVGDIENKSDWGCLLFDTGGKKKARCTYDWYGLPDKAKAPFDACIFAAAACRPQPDHVLCAKEEHQHNLLQTQSRGYSTKTDGIQTAEAAADKSDFLKAWLVVNVA